MKINSSSTPLPSLDNIYPYLYPMYYDVYMEFSGLSPGYPLIPSTTPVDETILSSCLEIPSPWGSK